MKNIYRTSLLFLCLLASSALAKPGDSKKLGKSAWETSSNSMVALNGKIYVSAGGYGLWVVEKTGKGKRLDPKIEGFNRTGKMAALNGKLYVLSEEKLWEVDPSGKAKKVGDEWPAAPGIAAWDGKLYIISSNELYEVDPSTGKYKSLSEDWYNIGGMTVLDGKLYIVRRDTLEEVDKNGVGKKLEGTWNIGKPMAAGDGKLYIFTSEATPKGPLINEYVLDSYDPKTNQRTRLSLPKGWERGNGAFSMVVLDGKLYMDAQAGEYQLFSLDLK